MRIRLAHTDMECQVLNRNTVPIRINYGPGQRIQPDRSRNGFAGSYRNPAETAEPGVGWCIRTVGFGIYLYHSIAVHTAGIVDTDPDPAVFQGCIRQLPAGVAESMPERIERFTGEITVGPVFHAVVFKSRKIIHTFVEGYRQVAAGVFLAEQQLGKRFSAADLGCYDKGRNFSYTISVNLDAAIRSVMFPVLSRAQDDREKFTGIMRQMSRLGSFVIFPVMLGLAAVAEPFIRLLLTEKWIAAAPILVILSIGEAQIPLTSANLIALKSLGRSDLYARQELVRRALMLVVLVISVVCFHSVEAIAVGYSVSAWLDVFVTSLPIKKLLNYGVLDQLRDVWKTALSTVLMALAVYALGALPLPTALLLMVQVLCGAAVYLGLNVLLKNESLMYILSLLGRRKAAS